MISFEDILEPIIDELNSIVHTYDDMQIETHFDYSFRDEVTLYVYNLADDYDNNILELENQIKKELSKILDKQNYKHSYLNYGEKGKIVLVLKTGE